MLGIATMAATWHPSSEVLVAQLLLGPSAPSSQVTNTTTCPVWYSALLKIVGRLFLSQVSPWGTVPSCMSSIRFGVTNEKAGRLFVARSVASWP